jgi:3-deoxy-D-manno-octulosonic-acid transferase
MSLALSAYSAAASIAFPFVKGRLRRSHAPGFAERCGVYAQSKLDRIRDRRTLWMHAVSVGEVQAASSVVVEIERSGWDGAVLLSTVTETGAHSANDLLGGSITSQVYAPWDVPSIVRRACRALRPAAYAAVETEVWPNLLAELRERGVPAILLNARISDRTFARAGLLGGILKEAYDMFDLILARGEEDARRLAVIGLDGAKIEVTGDTKIDALTERKRAAEQTLPALREKIFPGGVGACFVAGSTHEGEEEIVIDAFARLVLGEDSLEGAKLVIVPRHPERAASILTAAQKVGRASLFSGLGGAVDASVIVVDVIGVLFELYGLATAAFIGGSIAPKGGQNILEPAVWRIPSLHGPHMEDFADPCSQLDASGAAFLVNTPGEIEDLWRRAATGGIPRNAETPGYFARNSGAAARTWKRLEKYM